MLLRIIHFFLLHKIALLNVTLVPIWMEFALNALKIEYFLNVIVILNILIKLSQISINAFHFNVQQDAQHVNLLQVIVLPAQRIE